MRVVIGKHVYLCGALYSSVLKPACRLVKDIYNNNNIIRSTHVHCTLARSQSPFFLGFGHGPILVQINMQHRQAQPYGICTRIIYLTQKIYICYHLPNNQIPYSKCEEQWLRKDLNIYKVVQSMRYSLTIKNTRLFNSKVAKILSKPFKSITLKKKVKRHLKILHDNSTVCFSPSDFILQKTGLSMPLISTLSIS